MFETQLNPEGSVPETLPPKRSPVPIRTYRDLIVWQKALELTTVVYRLTELLPAAERFGLGTQMRRAAASIPANIAEGHERHSRGDWRTSSPHA